MKIKRAGVEKIIYPDMYDKDMDSKVDDSDKVDGYDASDLTPANLTDQTANRALGTTYQNTTGRYLLALVSIGAGTATGYQAAGNAYISSDNVTFERIARVQAVGNSSYLGFGEVVFIIPPNYYYYVSTASGNTLEEWWEVEL